MYQINLEDDAVLFDRGRAAAGLDAGAERQVGRQRVALDPGHEGARPESGQQARVLSQRLAAQRRQIRAELQQRYQALSEEKS